VQTLGKKEFLKACRYNCYGYSQFTTSFATKEIGLELKADPTAGRSNDIKIDNSSFERVEQFKYLGTTLTHKDSIQEEIRSD